MPLPTTSLYFNSTSPPAPDGDQNLVFQSDGLRPLQSISAYLPVATDVLRGVVKPDGLTIDVAPDGTLSVIRGGTGGTGGGGGTGGYVFVQPDGVIDGSNTAFTLPAPALEGTSYFIVRSGIIQNPFGPPAEATLDGTNITMQNPPTVDDWLGLWYIPGAASTQSGGGGGGVTPAEPGTFLQGSSGHAGSPSPVVVPFPSGNTAGSCIIVDVVWSNEFAGESTISVSDSQGNAYTRVGHIDGAIYTDVWIAPNCAGGPNTVTVSTSDGSDWTAMDVAIHEYYGIATSSPLDDVSTALDSGTVLGHGVATASVTTTQANDLLHVVAGHEGTPPVSATCSPGTARESDYYSTAPHYPVNISSFDATAPAVGSNSVTITWSAAVTWGQMILVALKSQ
jgi:hypothetical protein